MNAVSKLEKIIRKFVRELACLASEGRLFHKIAPLLLKLSRKKFVQTSD